MGHAQLRAAPSADTLRAVPPSTIPPAHATAQLCWDACNAYCHNMHPSASPTAQATGRYVAPKWIGRHATPGENYLHVQCKMRNEAQGSRSCIMVLRIVDMQF
jgi:hypothetical protein